MLTTRPRGTNDFLPGKVELWRFFENKVTELCNLYGFQEIRTPIFEDTKLFQRGVGETTDIVEKEMYSFKDKGDRDITLRPEGTASTVRAYLENKLYANPQPTKLYYIGPMFRYGRPQAGRFRQFHQFGVEVFGAEDPSIDAEIISLSMNILNSLGLKDLYVQLNSVGCRKCRSIHKKKLKEHLQKNFDVFCSTCQGRYEKNPLRIFDCKSETCQELVKDAPTITDCLCEECAEHLKKVQEYLDKVGVRYEIDPLLVRGLDYYTKTAFEIVFDAIGAQSAICGGGRYDGLVEECGGNATPGIGFAMGIERVLATLESQNLLPEINNGINVFVATVSSDLDIKAYEIIEELRENKISAEKDYLGRSLKAQLKYANKLGSKIVIILGEDELKNGLVNVKNMENSEQKEIRLENIIDNVKEILA